MILENWQVKFLAERIEKMVALITSDFQIPNNIAEGIFKKAQSGSTIAQLSGARPQKFGQETN